MPDVRKLAVTSTCDSQGCVAAEGRAMCRAMTPSAEANAQQKVPTPSWVAEEPVPPSRRDALPEPQVHSQAQYHMCRTQYMKFIG